MKRTMMEFWVQVTSDKRKAVVLGALLIIAGGIVLRAMLVDNGGPRKARASSKLSAALSSDGAGSGNVLSDREQARKERTEIPAPRPLERDLFALSARYFPLSPQTEAPVEETPKSVQGTDDNPREQERLRQQALVRKVNDEAATLRLRSTIVGANPIAVIETGKSGKSTGQVVPVGGVINGFRLIAVHSRSVLLEKSGVQVELGLLLP